jgi:hypothetical protein
MIDIELMINTHKKSLLTEDLRKEIADNWELGTIYEFIKLVNTTRGVLTWTLHYRQMIKNHSLSQIILTVFITIITVPLLT